MSKKKTYVTLKQQIVWLVSTAFGIAAALFWKDVIQEFITVYIPTEQTLTFSFYAAIVTSVVAIITVWLIHRLLKE